MPVDTINYNHRGGGNYGIVLRCPNVVADDRLVYFDHNRHRETWVIRDFIAGQRLDNFNSALSVAQIVADATYDEFPLMSSHLGATQKRIQPTGKHTWRCAARRRCS